MSKPEDYHHSSAHSFAGHQIDVLSHKDKQGNHVAEVRHPEYHAVIHTTEPQATKERALVEAKKWVHTSSPQAYRSRRELKIFKSEGKSMKTFTVKHKGMEVQATKDEKTGEVRVHNPGESNHGDLISTRTPKEAQVERIKAILNKSELFKSEEDSIKNFFSKK